MVPRCCESACCGSRDAGWRGYHEEGGSVTEDHPTFLCDHADCLHPLLHPSLLPRLPHTESVRGQSLPDRTLWVSKEGGVCRRFVKISCQQFL